MEEECNSKIRSIREQLQQINDQAVADAKAATEKIASLEAEISKQQAISEEAARGVPMD